MDEGEGEGEGEDEDGGAGRAKRWWVSDLASLPLRATDFTKMKRKLVGLPGFTPLTLRMGGGMW